jgi:MSHA biogenesis protein MshI
VELAEVTKQIKDKIRHLAKSYLKEEAHFTTNQHCCISIKGNQFSILAIKQLETGVDIFLHDQLQFEDFKSLSLVLSGVADSNNLTQTPIYWMLGPDDYQLNLIESLPVPANELQTALSWRIRSLITYHIDEAVLEYFELPAKKGASSTPLLGAVTAQKSLLNPLISLLKTCNLPLVTIDIPELALLNLASVYETDEKCTAFLYFYNKNIILNISCKKVLYFTRRINLPYTPDNTIDYEKLSLEILRYFDFFRSQWRLSSPTRIFAATEKGDMQIMAKALTDRLLNEVKPYTVMASSLSDTLKIEIANKFLLDYGCLLRKDNGNATPGN